MEKSRNESCSERGGPRFAITRSVFLKRTNNFAANPLSNQWNLTPQENPEGGKLNSWQQDTVPPREKAIHRTVEVGAALPRVVRIAVLRAPGAVHPRADANRAPAANTVQVQAKTLSVKCTNSSAVVSKWAAAVRK